MSIHNVQPLDVGHEYLVPGELDEGDLLALRARLLDMHELVEGSRLWTSKAVDADLPNDWSDIVLGTQRYHGARTKTGIAEDLIIETFLCPQDGNPMIRYKVADRPGQRAISITEPIMQDRSNYVSPASTISERLALISRWIDLTTRPIFQYYAFGDDEFKTSELILAERGQATATHARHIISNLLASVPSHTLHIASPWITLTYGGVYMAPVVGLSLGCEAPGTWMNQVLTNEAATALANDLPGIVEITQTYGNEGVAYSFAPWVSSHFSIADPLPPAERTSLLSRYPDRPLIPYEEYTPSW